MAGTLQAGRIEPIPMYDPADSSISAVFPTSLGWMVAVGSGRALRYLRIGYRSEAAACAVASKLGEIAQPSEWDLRLIERLQAYACGANDDFLDIDVDLGPLTRFQRRVYRQCRQIPFGTTLTYGQLAARAGFPRAARAVGHCMALNRIAVVIPCHRVVAAGGQLGGYSASGGVRLKRRLLRMEASPLI